MSQVRLVVPLLLWLLAMPPSFAQQMNEQDSPCSKLASTNELVECLSKARASSDTELNSVYQAIRKTLERSDAKRLISTQRLWTQYRDANCSAERSLYESGTGAYPAYLACLEAMTRARTKELRITYRVRLK
jgi:uncharacterized protein YecT (DUF1311 family)